jgi:ABC-type branched-subunit amino acid transport system ATPase component
MILRMKKINKHFGGVHALNNCTLDINRGKITAIIGPNGSGKTTLFNAITNLIDIDSGNIILDNSDITELKDFEIAKLGVSRTFQQVRLFRNLTIRDHFEIALSVDDEKLLKNLFARSKITDAKIWRFMDLVGLDKPLNTFGSDLSYGQRKLLDLALAISKPHSILLLDEPVAGVNPVLRQEIKKIILGLKENGETILVIEHDMDFVMGIADEIFVMESGKIIAHGNPEQIQNDKKVLEAYLGG